MAWGTCHVGGPLPTLETCLEPPLGQRAGQWNRRGMATALENDPTFSAPSEMEHPLFGGECPASGERDIDSRHMIKRV